MQGKMIELVEQYQYMLGTDNFMGGTAQARAEMEAYAAELEAKAATHDEYILDAKRFRAITQSACRGGKVQGYGEKYHYAFKFITNAETFAEAVDELIKEQEQ